MWHLDLKEVRSLQSTWFECLIWSNTSLFHFVEHHLNFGTWKTWVYLGPCQKSKWNEPCIFIFLKLCRTNCFSSRFPPITALEWSPLHNLKSLRRKQEQQQEKSPDAVKDDNDNPASLVAKEHFVFTDPEGQLYHFSVEGNAIKDGTKVPAEASLCKSFLVKFQWFFFSNLNFLLQQQLHAYLGRVIILFGAIVM